MKDKSVLLEVNKHLTLLPDCLLRLWLACDWHHLHKEAISTLPDEWHHLLVSHFYHVYTIHLRDQSQTNHSSFCPSNTFKASQTRLKVITQLQHNTIAFLCAEDVKHNERGYGQINPIPQWGSHQSLAPPSRPRPQHPQTPGTAVRERQVWV